MAEDDFARKVYCVLGVPVDDIDMAGVVDRIHRAASTRKPLFLSTPNLNYLMLSQRDPEFRHSLLESDLCPADGMGVLLICRLLGVPITARVAGSDLPAALQDFAGLRTGWAAPRRRSSEESRGLASWRARPSTRETRSAWSAWLPLIPAW